MFRENKIWNGIGKGKYKLSFHLWVGMWVRKKKMKYTYTNKHSRNFDVFDALAAWACTGPSYKITHQQSGMEKVRVSIS